MPCLSTNLLGSFEYKTLQNRIGQWEVVFRNLSAEQNVKKHNLFCSLIHFLVMKHRTRQMRE